MLASASIGGWTLALIGGPPMRCAHSTRATSQRVCRSGGCSPGLPCTICDNRRLCCAAGLAGPGTPVWAVHGAVLVVHRTPGLFTGDADVRHSLHGDALR